MSQIGSIDDVVYGNPTYSQSLVLSEIYYLDTLFEPLKQFRPPSNSSTETKGELSLIASRIRSIRDNTDITRLSEHIHFHFDNFWQEGLLSRGVNIDYNIFNELSLDAFNVAYKLKYNFDRPRPYQLAAYYKLALFPNTTYGIESPAYPSFFYLKSLLFTHVLADAYTHNVFKDLTSQVFNSRIDLGYNFLSDLRYSEKIFNAMIRHKGFINKYELDIRR